MEIPQQQPIPILEIAWTRFAQFDSAAIKRSKSNLQMRRWIVVLGVLATLFAILTEAYSEFFGALGGFILKFLLVVTPVLASGLAAFASRSYSGGDWLVKRAGAEEIRKEIYMFRTVLQKTSSRRTWLEKRLAEIQRQVYRGLGGELTIPPYEGQLPPEYFPDDPNSDPGFNDLTGEEYFRYRLAHQLGYHENKVNKYQAERTRLQIFIILAGAAGAVLAALGGPFSLWVALTASLTAAFIGWQELRNLDSIIRNYSKVIMELNIIFDHWSNLEPEERSSSEFYKMVNSTEEILWSQNVEYIKSMQEALKDASLEEEASLVNRVIKESVESDARFKKSLEDAMVEHTTATLTDSQGTLTETYESALGTLAEEASSELVQAELAAMQQAVSEAAQDLAERVSSGFKSSIQAIAEEFDGVEIGRDTPMSVLNDLMSRYPKTNDVKG
jgi:hypothetical protein